MIRRDKGGANNKPSRPPSHDCGADPRFSEGENSELEGVFAEGSLL